MWSVCLGNDGNLQGQEEESDLVKLPKMDQLYKGNKMQDVGLPMACSGETKYRMWYKDATFCNGGYKYATAASHYAIDATRVHRTMPGVVSFSSLRPFGPRRGVAAMASTRCHAASAPSRRWRVGEIYGSPLRSTPRPRHRRDLRERRGTFATGIVPRRSTPCC